MADVIDASGSKQLTGHCQVDISPIEQSGEDTAV